MKTNINFFTHDTDCRNHPKHKALIAAYGYAGYGQFWRLNEIIGAAPECKLDISRKIYFNALADELRMTPAELQEFIAFLSDSEECGLLKVVDNRLVTDRTQADLEIAMKSRKAAKRRRSGASGDELETSAYRRATNDERRPTVGRREARREGKGKEEKEGGTSKINITRSSDVPSRADGTSAKPPPPAAFYSWLLEFLRSERNMRAPDQFAAKVIKDPEQYPDLIAAYESSRPSDPQPPAPAACPECGGRVKSTTSVAQCQDCGAFWEYCPSSSAWDRSDTDDPFSDDVPFSDTG